MTIITTGKLRALQRASTPEHVFAILAVDHQDALRRVLQPDDPLSVTPQEMTTFKLDVAGTFQSEVSGVLLDPVFGAAQAIYQGATSRIGLLLELEKADYQMESLPLVVEIDPDWSVEKIKRMGADGVKLFFYYAPHDPAHTAKQDEIIKKVVMDCDLYDIPLYAEPIVHNVPDRMQGIIESAKRIAALGVDVLKLEFPGEADDEAGWVDACQQLTSALDIPWVLLSAGVAFDTFCKQVSAACEAGAAGFIVGRAVWGDAAAMPDRQQRYDWLRKEGRQRMHLLTEIARNHAHPWTKYLQAAPVSTNWFKHYSVISNE